MYRARYLKDKESHCCGDHCGAPGNERAERLAIEGGECEQSNNEFTYFKKKRATQTIRRYQCQEMMTPAFYIISFLSRRIFYAVKIVGICLILHLLSQ